MASSCRWNVFRLACLAVGLCAAAAQDVFSEEALATWVSPGHVMVHLRFDQATSASRHHTSFPHSMQHLATSLPLDRVELSLTHGRWDEGRWGQPLIPSKPTGAVLEATFLGPAHNATDASCSDSHTSAPRAPSASLSAHWSALVHALSGLTCTTLSSLRDTARVVAGGRLRLQDLAAGAGTDTAGGGGSDRWHLIASLPREASCTENLTPWLRLLPCRDAAGLAALLRNRPAVFSAEYGSFTLQLHATSTAEGRRAVRLVQTATLVLRADGGAQQKQQQQLGLATAAATAAGAGPGALQLHEVLGADMRHACPAALRSHLYLALPEAGVRTVREEQGRAAGSCSADGLAAGSCAWEGKEGVQGLAAAEGSAAAAAGGGPGPEVPLCTWEYSAVLLPVADTAAPVGFLPALRVFDSEELLQKSEGNGLLLPLPPPPHPSYTDGPWDGPGGGGSGMGAAGNTGHSDGAWGMVAHAPAVTTQRYTTGQGLLRGGMVLRVERSAALRQRLRDLAGPGLGEVGLRHAAEGEAGPAPPLAHTVCVHQELPWYIRPWMHTLQLTYDGQEVPLHAWLLSRRVQPARGRTAPAVLDLCLHVPPHVGALELSVRFSKGFLTVGEYPPDAHRGFDIPAAVVSYGEPRGLRRVQWAMRTGEAAQEQQTGQAGQAGQAGQGQEQLLATPLLGSLPPSAFQQVFTAPLLVPLAAPDFSMPYNVICLSSTVLAVYFGAVLNLLTKREDRGRLGAGEAQGVGALKGELRSGRGAKALKLLVFVLLFASLALYLDADMRSQVEQLVQGLLGQVA